MLLNLINATLCKRPLNERFLEGVTEENWQQCFDLALPQNVLAMTFPVISSLPKELRPSFTLWLKWMAYAQSIAEQSQYKREVVKKFGVWLADDGLSTTLIKGFSLSVLYPNPNLREFSDIDIFSGKDYEAVNACFAKHGVKVKSVDGHHAYLNIDGILVEHHFAFHNTKVKNGLVGPEEALQQLAVANPQSTAVPGISFPCPIFTALFVGWHAYEHFLQEKIQLRHVIDWVLALRALTPGDAVVVRQLIKNTTWGRFINVLTALAIRRMCLPQQWFPSMEIDVANKVEQKQVQWMWDDIMNAPCTPKSKSSNLRRIYIAKRMLKNSWKFKEYSNTSASKFLMEEFVGHVRGRSLIINH